MRVRIFWILFISCIASLAQAQFLANNTTLNAQSLQRWMESNRDMASVIQVVDGMHSTAESLTAFDALAPAEQDKQIDSFLATHHWLDRANLIANRHGWKSVGEFMRLGTRLGNAIAAYFFEKNSASLSAEQVAALREQTDPAVLDVPAADLAFVKANEKILQHYIQAYSAGR